MKCHIIEDCDFDGECKGVPFINLLHTRTLFSEVIGVKVSLELEDSNGDPLGVIDCKMSFNEARDFAHKLLNIIGNR